VSSRSDTGRSQDYGKTLPSGYDPGQALVRSHQAMASLADISRRAGVSLATASRVLSGSTHPVSEPTRERVLAAARELGYAPSALARALVTRNSRIIGVIVGNIVDPYFAEIARGIEDVAGRMGYLTMLCSADRSSTAELEHLRVLRDYSAAGLVFASSGYLDDPHAGELSDAVDAVRSKGSTVVALARREFDCLTARFDNHAAAYDITDYLISLGHRRIAFVEGPMGLFTSIQRREGFTAAMTAAGLDPDLRFDGGFEYEAGYGAALRLMGAGELPDAIVGVNDEVAIGVLMSLRQAGVDVPGRVSVAGIDDTRPASFVELSTVSVPLYELGAVAARAILAGGKDQPPDYVLPHRLTPRATTARRRG
jgi:LacI family transcriptional regulator, galactose operon repressor